MREEKLMHDAKWVGAMVYGQRTIRRPRATISQGQVSGSAGKNLVSGSSMCQYLFPDIGDVSQTCPLGIGRPPKERNN